MRLRELLEGTEITALTISPFGMIEARKILSSVVSWEGRLLK